MKGIGMICEKITFHSFFMRKKGRERFSIRGGHWAKRFIFKSVPVPTGFWQVADRFWAGKGETSPSFSCPVPISMRIWSRLYPPVPVRVPASIVTMDDQILSIVHVVRATQLQATVIKNNINLPTRERNARLHKNENIRVEAITEVDNLLAANEVTLKNEYDNVDDIQVSCYMSSPPEQFSNANKYKSKKRKVEQEFEVIKSRLIDSINNVASAIQEGNRILERVYHHEYTGEEIYKQLKPMCLQPNELKDAMMFLAENQAKTRLLFSCPFEIRMSMLKKDDERR
ncbi:hypothetical protein R6Q57_028402 [Mikania cordata]